MQNEEIAADAGAANRFASRKAAHEDVAGAVEPRFLKFGSLHPFPKACDLSGAKGIVERGTQPLQPISDFGIRDIQRWNKAQDIRPGLQ